MTESSPEADLGLEDILPDVFKFPNEAARDGKFRWKLPKGDNTPHISDDVEIFDHKRFPQEFQNIFGAIKQETKPNIKLAKVGPGVELEGHKPIAHVIKHGNHEDGVSRTVVIQNIPEAHKAFGIKNVPKQFFKQMEKVIKSGAIPFSAKPKIESALSKKQRQDKAFEKGTLRGDATFDLNKTSEDREYSEDDFEEYKDEYASNSSDYYEAEENLEIIPKLSNPTPRTIIIKNTAEDFARFGVTNLPKDLVPLLQENTRDAKAVNVEMDTTEFDTGITKGENNGVFFNPRRTHDIQSSEAPGVETEPSSSYNTLLDKTVNPAESPDAGSVNLPSISSQNETPLQFKSENNIAPPSEYSRSSARDTIPDNTNQLQAKLSVKSTLESELEDNNGSDQSSSITGVGLENTPLQRTFGGSSARLTLPVTSSSGNLSPSELSSSTSSEYFSPSSSFPSEASFSSSSLPDPSSSSDSDYSSPLSVPISSSLSDKNSPFSSSSSSSSSVGSSDYSSLSGVSSSSSEIPISIDYSSSSGVLSASDNPSSKATPIVSSSSSSDYSSPVGNTIASISSSSSSSPLAFSSSSSSSALSSSSLSSSEYAAPSDGSAPSPSSSDYSSPIGSPLTSSFHSSAFSSSSASSSFSSSPSPSSSSSSSDYSSPLGNPISSSSSTSSSDYSSPLGNPISSSSSSSSGYSSPPGTPLSSSSYSGSSGVSASSSSSLPVSSSFSSQPSSAPSISSPFSYSSSSSAFLSNPTPGSIVKSNPGSRAPSSSINYSARPNPPKQSNQNQDVSPQNIPQFILSSQPAGILKSVPEIMKPNKGQEYERPSSPQTSGGFKPPNIIYNQFKPAQGASEAQDNQYILTNRPMTFQTASGNFLPPSTLLYGFKPITEPGFINRPTNPPRSNSESAKYLGKTKSSINNSGSSSNHLQASYLQEKPRFKKSFSNSRDSSSSSVIDQISQFLESLFN